MVVEYGYFDNDPAQLDPSSAANYRTINMFNASSVPQPGLGGRVSGVFAASVVGGGSTVNGMMFDRGAADDYDNWEKLGNPGWGFSDLLPYFKKVSQDYYCHPGCGCDLTNADSCRVRTLLLPVRT